MEIIARVIESVAPHCYGAEISMLHCNAAIEAATRPVVPNGVPCTKRVVNRNAPVKPRRNIQ